MCTAAAGSAPSLVADTHVTVVTARRNDFSIDDAVMADGEVNKLLPSHGTGRRPQYQVTPQDSTSAHFPTLRVWSGCCVATVCRDAAGGTCAADVITDPAPLGNKAANVLTAVGGVDGSDDRINFLDLKHIL
jgi:hypothetical protein